MKTNLNLPDHTPAPETLAFAHELAVLAATQTEGNDMSDELAALATAMRDARTDANVLYDLLERAFNVAAVVKPAVNVLTGEVKSLRQQVDALTKERDELLIGRRVKTTIPMGNVIWWELATQDGKEFTPTPPGLEGVITRYYGHYGKRLIVEFDDGVWADYEPEKFAFI